MKTKFWFHQLFCNFDTTTLEKVELKKKDDPFSKQSSCNFMFFLKIMKFPL